MNYKDAFHKTVHSTHGGVEALAVRMGYTTGLLRNKANPNSTTNVLTMDDASRVMEITCDYAVLHALAEQHGITLTKVDEQPATDMAVLENVTHIWQLLGEVANEVHETLKEGKVERHEVAAVRAAVFKAFCPMMQLIEHLNGMAEK